MVAKVSALILRQDRSEMASAKWIQPPSATRSLIFIFFLRLYSFSPQDPASFCAQDALGINLGYGVKEIVSRIPASFAAVIGNCSKWSRGVPLSLPFPYALPDPFSFLCAWLAFSASKRQCLWPGISPLPYDFSLPRMASAWCHHLNTNNRYRCPLNTLSGQLQREHKIRRNGICRLTSQDELLWEGTIRSWDN